MDGSIQERKDGINQKCKYKEDCINFFGSCDEDCHIIDMLQENRIPPFIKGKITSINNNIIGVCPRSNNTIKINNRCSNIHCPYFNGKLITSCLYLHSNIFNKDILGLISTTLNIDKRYLDFGLKISTYSIRLYIILLLYIYNIKPEILDTLSEEGIETFNIFQNMLAQHNQEWINETQNEHQLKFNKKWIILLEKKKLKEDITSIGYKKFYSEYHKYSDKIKLLRLLLDEIKIEEIKLTDVPLLYLVRTYYSLFGYIDIVNFGLSDKKGKKMIDLYLEDNKEKENE